MEQWEIDLRAKLQAELPDVTFVTGSADFPMYLNKTNYIDFEIAMRKEFNKVHFPDKQTYVVGYDPYKREDKNDTVFTVLKRNGEGIMESVQNKNRYDKITTEEIEKFLGGVLHSKG